MPTTRAARRRRRKTPTIDPYANPADAELQAQEYADPDPTFPTELLPTVDELPPALRALLERQRHEAEAKRIIGRARAKKNRDGVVTPQ